MSVCSDVSNHCYQQARSLSVCRDVSKYRYQQARSSSVCRDVSKYRYQQARSSSVCRDVSKYRYQQARSSSVCRDVSKYHDHQHQQPLAVGGGGGGGRGGCRGTTDVLMIFLQPSLSSASLGVLARGSSVHSLMSSCQHFFGLPRLLPPGTVPCMVVFASPVARVTCPYHLSFLVLTIERRSSCGPMAALTRFLTSSFVILSLDEMPKIFL